MTALDGSPHGTTETGAAYAEAAARYRPAAGKYPETAGWAVSALAAIASGEQPQPGESAAEYAKRHLEQMTVDKFITRGAAA